MHSQEFKIIDTKFKNKFLNKAKQARAKKTEGDKKQYYILTVQKHIRNYLTKKMLGGKHYPLLISNVDCLKNKDYIEYCLNKWKQLESAILIQRLFRLGMAICLQGGRLQVDSTILVQILVSGSVNLSKLEYGDCELLLNNCYFRKQQYLTLLQYSNFKAALSNKIQGKFYELIAIVCQLEHPQISNDLINRFISSSEQTEIQESADEELIIRSFSKLIAYSLNASKSKQDNSIKLLAIVLKQLKNYYLKRISIKYNVDMSILHSQSLREEVEELLQQKPEWQQYVSHLFLLNSLSQSLIRRYIYGQQFEVEAIINLLVQVTSIASINIKIELKKEQFFGLLEKLDSKNPKINELLLNIICLQKYLEGVNDLSFVRTYAYDKQELKKIIKSYLVRFMKNLTNLHNLKMSRQLIEHSMAFINNLYNKIFRTQILPSTVFQDPSLTFYQDHYLSKTYLKDLERIIEISPYMVPIQTRFVVFKSLVDSYKHNYYGSQPKLIIHRQKQFEDALTQLQGYDIRSPLRVRFYDKYGYEEKGIDGGGLTKQFLTRIFKTAFHPKTGLFIQNAKKELIPNPIYSRFMSSEISRRYEFVGQLLGKSLYQNIMLGVKFAGPFLNLLIKKRNGFDDLLVIDPDLYKSIIFIAEMKEGIEDLCLNFQYHDSLTNSNIKLCPRGDQIKVTAKNKMQYLSLLINFKVNTSFQAQAKAIRKGLKKVIKNQWICMFNFIQLNDLFSGTGVIDVEDWARHTNVNGDEKADTTIRFFWQIVSNMSEDDKSLLLKFVTSCERPSFLGFRDLSPHFTILVTKNTSGLPVAHTCSNVLQLPNYDSMDLMRQRILTAIRNAGGFDLA